MKLKESSQDTDIKPIPWFCFAIMRAIGDELAFFTADRKQYCLRYTLADQMVIVFFILNDQKDVGKDIPKTIYNRLYDYQKECVNQGIRCLGRILIADEMVY